MRLMITANLEVNNADNKVEVFQLPDENIIHLQKYGLSGLPICSMSDVKSNYHVLVTSSDALPRFDTQ